jgi:hypothetical protein
MARRAAAASPDAAVSRLPRTHARRRFAAGRVAWLMRQAGIAGITSQGRGHTRHDGSEPGADLVGRSFDLLEADACGGRDRATRRRRARVYPAAVPDAFGRRVVGWNRSSMCRRRADGAVAATPEGSPDKRTFRTTGRSTRAWPSVVGCAAPTRSARWARSGDCFGCEQHPRAGRGRRRHCSAPSGAAHVDRPRRSGGQASTTTSTPAGIRIARRLLTQAVILRSRQPPSSARTCATRRRGAPAAPRRRGHRGVRRPTGSAGRRGGA